MNNSVVWIKIYQSIRQHWIWVNPLYLKWWIDLLMLAEWKDSKKLICSTLVTIKRGELVASVSYLRERWRYKDDDGKERTPSDKTIIKYLNMLEKDGMISRSHNLPNRTTLITIVNYNDYQQNSSDVKSTVESTSGSTLESAYGSTSGSEIKEYKNINNNNTLIGARDLEKNSSKEQWRIEVENDQIFWEQTAMSFSCNLDWLKSLLSKFHSENIACDFNEHTFNDYRRDFFNYARRENQNRLRNANQCQSKSNSGSRSGGSSASIGGHGLNE